MQILQANGQMLACRHRKGRGGPCVVFINPLGTEQCLWDEVIAALPNGFDTVTYDLRGHGLSGMSTTPSLDDLAQDLCALAQALSLSNVILCGMGLGGMIAQSVASCHPGWLAGLVLTDTATRIGRDTLWNSRIAAVKEHGIKGVMAAPLPEENAAALLCETMQSRVSAPAYVAMCEMIRDADLAPVAGRIQVPTLCIASNCDPSIPTEAVKALTSAVGHARLEVLQNVKSMPALEVPDQMANLIAQMAPVPRARYASGMAVRREVLGGAHVDRAEAEKTSFDVDFQALITEGAWGSVWASPGISRRDRSMLTVALLAALGNFDEIPMHVRATRRTGATERDLTETFQHVAIYAGVPRANHALKLARETLARLKEDGHD